MAFDAKQKRELLDALKGFAAAHGPDAIPTANGKALEAWLIMALAEAAKAKGWQVELCDGAGNPLAPNAPFKLRGQHGGIAKASASKPGFVRLTNTTLAGYTISFELHDSLQWEGRSQALHEFDVSVIAAPVGQSLRQHGGGRPVGLPVAAVECKDKDSAGPIGDVREKVARLFDATHVQFAAPQNGHRQFESKAHAGFGTRHRSYTDAWSDGYFAIARQGGWQWGADKLANKYEVALVSDIYNPVALKTLTTDFVDYLDTCLI